jgi:hypothetical protein
MSATLTAMPPGYYTIPEIEEAAKTHFPDAYNALIRPTQLAWEDVNFPGLYDRGIMVGYIKVANAAEVADAAQKVLAVMQQDDHKVLLCTPSGVALSSRENSKLQLVAPWSCLWEGGPRPQLVMLRRMCQYFFAASEGVWVEKANWLRSLEVGCRKIQYGSGKGVLGQEIRKHNGGDE